MDNLAFDYSSWWFSALVFMLYCVYQFVLYEFFRYYPFAITTLFVLAIILFAPFLIWPTHDLYHILLYIVASSLFLYIATIRIAYFNIDHIQVNKNRLNKSLHEWSMKIHLISHSAESDTESYNKLAAIIIYGSLGIHIIMFVIIDVYNYLTNNSSILNSLCGLFLLMSIPIPPCITIILPSYRAACIDENRKYNTFELLVPISYGWIILYSLWITLCILSWVNTCTECHIHIVILIIIPLIRSLYKKRNDLWFTSYIFGIAAMSIFTAPFYQYFLNSDMIYYSKYIKSGTSTQETYDNIMMVFGTINVLYGFAFFMFHLRWIYYEWLNEQNNLKQHTQSQQEQDGNNNTNTAVLHVQYNNEQHSITPSATPQPTTPQQQKRQNDSSNDSMPDLPVVVPFITDKPKQNIHQYQNAHYNYQDKYTYYNHYDDEF